MLLILDKIHFSHFTIFALLFKFSHYGWKIEYLFIGEEVTGFLVQLSANLGTAYLAESEFFLLKVL